MNIDESVQRDSSELEKKLDDKRQDFEYAFIDFSRKIDNIIHSILIEYSNENNVELNLDDIKNYKFATKVITSKLDSMISEFLNEKRKIYQ